MYSYKNDTFWLTVVISVVSGKLDELFQQMTTTLYNLTTITNYSITTQKNINF